LWWWLDWTAVLVDANTWPVFFLNFLEGINFGKSGHKNPPEIDNSKLGTGRATLRLRSTGPATVEEEVQYN
jgi:hypothetical protein